MRALITIALLLCFASAANAQDLPSPVGTEPPPPVEDVQKEEEQTAQPPGEEEAETGAAEEPAEETAPPPPRPVVRSGGFMARFPGYEHRERRTVRSFDLGFSVSGRSPIGWANKSTLYYLNLGAAFTNHLFHLEVHTMFVPLLIDALLGIGMINTNLAQSDDFPPFVQTFNSSASQGIYELGNVRAGFHFAASERTSWSYDFHSHALFLGAPIGELADFFIGLGAAVTHTWIDPVWDLSLSAYAGPEIGSDLAYFAGVDLMWRRALAKGFGGYLRWNAAGHYLTVSQRFLPSGIIEAGFSFSNWK
jgi:hypothetical protein